jgi:hypothetical protein
MKPSDSQQGWTKENEMNAEDKYFKALKSVDHGNQFDETAKWIREHNFNTKIITSERKLSAMKNYFLAHKMRLVYTVIVLAALIGACSMPVTQHETLGYVMSWSVPKGTSSDQIDQLQWVKNGQLTVYDNSNSGVINRTYNLVLPPGSEQQINSYRKDLERFNDITFLKIVPLNENVKRPVYAVALNSVFKLNIDATKMSNEELENEVKEQLESLGFGITNIDFKTDENGRRMIKLNLEHTDSNKMPGNFEMKIKDGNNEEVIKTVKKQADQFQGKTDEEIRKLVKEDLNNPDIQDKDIHITRENGKVNVKVEVEKN